MTPGDLVRSKLQGVAADGRTALCPAHDDKRKSLSISEGDDGRTLLKCHASCSVGDIVKAIGLEFRDLFAINGHRNGARHTNKRVVATYDYQTEVGELLYQAVRFEPKDFQQRRPDGRGDWVWTLAGVRRVPYRLRELVAASPDSWVWIVEGEKDSDRLAALGFVSTTNAGGAGKWRAEYNAHLRARRVAIVPDNDEPGEDHARKVARGLLAIAAEVRIVRLPNQPPKGDASDFLDAGGSKEQLVALLEQAHPATSADLADTLPRPWIRISDVQREAVDWVWYRRIPRAKLSTLDGDPGLGKSTLMLEVAARATRGQALPHSRAEEPCGVVILSAEDSLSDTIRPRLEAAGADLDRIVAIGSIPGRDGGEAMPEIPRDLSIIEAAARDIGAGLIVIDPLVAYLGAATNSFIDADVRRALAPLSKLAEETGAAIVLIRHLNKKTDGGNPLYRGGGSIGIIGAARSGLLVARDPDDDENRILAVIKSNLCFPPPALSFRLETADDVHRIEWLGDSAHNGAEILGGTEAAEQKSALDEAKEVLREILRGGPVAARAAQKQASDAGVSSRTLERARAALKVIARKTFVSGAWTWELPSGTNKTAKPSRDDRHRENVGDHVENRGASTTTKYAESLEGRQHRQECQGTSTIGGPGGVVGGVVSDVDEVVL